MRRRHVVLRAAGSIGLLAGLAWWLDLGPVVSRLAQMRFGWVLLAVAISGAFRPSCRDPESKAVIQVLWFRWICLRDGFSEADSNFR